ncbi:hypothetical protein FKP32DRAFT_1550277, partial [Trametes sanguinea]
WLIVLVDGTGPPVIFRVIQQGWILACDERSLTLLMRIEDATNFSAIVHKLRFRAPQDFWVFMSHISYGRVQA